MAIKKTDTARKPSQAKSTGYTPKPGTENHVHAMICIPQFERIEGKMEMQNLNPPYLSLWTPADFKELVFNRSGYEINEVKYYPPGCKTMEQLIKEETEKQAKKAKK